MILPENWESVRRLCLGPYQEKVVLDQATREKVLEFIEAHDYRPNVMARGLAQRKTFNLALLLPKDYAVTEFPFFKDCMQGICEVASSHDYDVIISMLDGDDLSQIQRFEAYEAVTAHKKGRKVLTYVIYSGEITSARTELDCGLYTYKVSPIYLTDYDADKIFLRMQEKLDSGEALNEEDYAGLALAPLMSGKLSRKEKIKKAILFAKQGDTVTAEKTIAILYTLADKFLKGKELQEVREVVSMTRIGQMIYNDGVEKGMEKGMDKMSLLTARLLKEKRLDDLQRATEDKAYCEQLLKEYGIE